VAVAVAVAVETYSRLVATDNFTPLTANCHTANCYCCNINKAFKYVYSIRLLGKRIKAYDRNLYYAVKYSLMLLILYLIFF